MNFQETKQHDRKPNNISQNTTIVLFYLCPESEKLCCKKHLVCIMWTLQATVEILAANAIRGVAIISEVRGTNIQSKSKVKI